MEQFFVDSHQTLTFMLDLVSQHISILQGPSRPVNLSLFYLVKLPYQSSSKLTAHEMKTCSRLFYTVLFLLCPNSGFFSQQKRVQRGRHHLVLSGRSFDVDAKSDQRQEPVSNQNAVENRSGSACHPRGFHGRPGKNVPNREVRGRQKA